MQSVLFVCLGNICRSPMAEGMFAAELARRQVTGIEIDSAGTGAWHIGKSPDRRAISKMAERGIDIGHLRARQVAASDFERFDLIAAMDAANLAHLRASAGPTHSGKVRLFLDYARDLPIREVPDPYYGGDDGFDRAFDLLETAARGLADHIISSRS